MAGVTAILSYSPIWNPKPGRGPQSMHCPQPALRASTTGSCSPLCHDRYLPAPGNPPRLSLPSLSCVLTMDGESGSLSWPSRLLTAPLYIPRHSQLHTFAQLLLPTCTPPSKSLFSPPALSLVSPGNPHTSGSQTPPQALGLPYTQDSSSTNTYSTHK